MKEKLSAFMDNELGELEERRVLAELAADPELRVTWERYHLVRAVIREEGVAPVPGLSERVARQLPDAAPAAAGARVPRPLLRAAAGLALAAAVAAVAIFGLQVLRQPGQPAQLAAGKTPRAETARWNTDRPEHETTLNAYLVEHNEFAPTGMGGMTPYARVVGYDREK